MKKEDAKNEHLQQSRLNQSIMEEEKEINMNVFDNEDEHDVDEDKYL